MINPGTGIIFLEKDSVLASTGLLAAMDTATCLNSHIESLGPQDAESRTRLNLKRTGEMIKEWLIPNWNTVFTERFCNEIVALNSVSGYPSEQEMKNLFLIPGFEAFGQSNRQYSTHIKWLSVFLLALRAKRAVVLPFRFSCPVGMGESADGIRRIDLGAEFHGRLLNSTRDGRPYDGFTASVQSQGVSYCSKLLLATGWIDTPDVNHRDLSDLWKANQQTTISGGSTHPPWKMMLSRFNIDFDDFPISIQLFEKEIKAIVKQIRQSSMPKQRKSRCRPDSNIKFETVGVSSDIEQILTTFASASTPLVSFYADEAAKTECVAVLGAADTINSRTWIALETAYVAKIRRENYKGIRRALGLLNLYLFGYLWNWHRETTDAVFAFPSSPELIKTGFHVSRLLIDKYKNAPITLMEFLGLIAKRKEWAAETLYADIKHLEGFFDFLELHSEELPACSGFKQPINAHDFPRVARSIGTNKGLIPRKTFGFLLAYIDSLADFVHKLWEMAIRENLNKSMFPWDEGKCLVIDLDSHPKLAAIAPSFKWNGTDIKIRHVPNILRFAKFQTIVDGKTVSRLLPRPHSLHHIIVALQTGLRGNHIQWLDADTYGNFADRNADFTRLLVNTDKVKTSAWTPYVAKRVVEILDRQKKWRDAIAEPGFERDIHYNGNERTKWGSFRPLFSCNQSGTPHGDGSYVDDWKILIAHAQVAMIANGFDCPVMARLRPKGVAFEGSDIASKLVAAGKSDDIFIPLTWATNTTPHSARVSVVSHFITALPADLIGKFITGQTPAVVGHYVKLDPDQLANLSREQRTGIEREMHQQAFNRLFDPEHQGDLIDAGPRSSLAKSFSKAPAETLSRFGCVSLQGSTDMKTGMQVCSEAVPQNVAFNKTEICPHGNHCPPEVVRELKSSSRCGLCPRAIRSVDHLPAVAAKCKQVYESLSSLETKMNSLDSRLHMEDLESMETSRQLLCEELVGWLVAQEVLESVRQGMAGMIRDEDDTKWIAHAPEIIQRELSRIDIKSNETEYVMSRMPECLAYPSLEGPEIRARFDLLRRKLAAGLGDFKTAFDLVQIPNPAATCAGLLKNLAAANDIDYSALAGYLESKSHLQGLAPPVINQLTTK